VAGVLSGFFSIWVIIGLGWLLAHLRVLREDAQPVLSQVSFFVGAPALLFEVMADADLGPVFAPPRVGVAGRDHGRRRHLPGV